MKFREHILSYAAYIALGHAHARIDTHTHARTRTPTHRYAHTHTHSVRYLLFPRRQELPSGFGLAIALAWALAGFPLSGLSFFLIDQLPWRPCGQQRVQLATEPTLRIRNVATRDYLPFAATSSLPSPSPSCCYFRSNCETPAQRASTASLAARESDKGNDKGGQTESSKWFAFWAIGLDPKRPQGEQ